MVAKILEFGPGGAQIALELGWGMGDGFGRGVKLFDPKVEGAPRDTQFSSDGRSGTVSVDVHFDGSVFEFLIVDTSLFPRSNHSAIGLCPQPLTLSTKWRELHSGQAGQVAQMGQMGQAGHPGQAG